MLIEGVSLFIADRLHPLLHLVACSLERGLSFRGGSSQKKNRVGCGNKNAKIPLLLLMTPWIVCTSLANLFAVHGASNKILVVYSMTNS